MLHRLISKHTILVVLITYIILSLLYIHPGEISFLKGDVSRALSDGTDPVTFPYQFNFIIDQFKEKPSDFFFGAIHNPYMDVPDGAALWVPFIERIEILFLSFFTPIEQISTGLTVFGLILDSLIMFFLSRALGIPGIVSWGMGIAWAFNAYTRARATVHVGLVSIYHLPLAFLAIVLLTSKHTKKYIGGSILCMGLVWLPYYYIITLAAFTPVFIIFIWLKKPPDENAKKFALKIFLALLPAILWLTHCLVNPLPPWVSRQASAFPKTGETKATYHPYLIFYAAHPIDFFTGDIGLGSKDLNPLRESLNLSVEKNGFDGSHPHERALGIRWSLWALAFAAFLNFFPSSKLFWSPGDKALAYIFFSFGVVSLWLSLPPDWPIEGGGLSLWLHRLVPQLRVPNRAGIGVGFSVIMLSGLYLKNFFTYKNLNPLKRQLVSWGYVFLILIELPPFLQSMPVARIHPRFEKLTVQEYCGWGFHYPYVSGQTSVLSYYYLLQKMRGSHCGIINSSVPSEIDQAMTNAFSEEALIADPQFDYQTEALKLKAFVDCVPLNWIVIDGHILKEGNRKLCLDIGWIWNKDGSCVRNGLGKKPSRGILHCLND